jgi:hypothetical protein
MRTMTIALATLAFVLTGFAAAPQTAVSPPSNNVYTGEVWTWDARDNTVTLRQGASTFRVSVTPDQIRTLRLHETATVRGTLAGPAPIATVVAPATAMRAVPRGPGDQSGVRGTVTALDPKGLISVDSPQGKLTVWTATADATRFRAGSPVVVRTSVQPVDMVPDSSGTTAPGQTAPPEPAASVSSEPGDYATVIGPVTTVDARTITIGSPRGSVTVPVTNPSQFRPGMQVQVRTFVSAVQ